MVKSSIFQCALLLITLAGLIDAAAFLPARAQVTREDVKQLLLSELSGQTNAPRLSSIEKEMLAMFTALPKSPMGRLEPPTVRYALHRFFVQKHGWFVKGLDTAGAAWNSTAASIVLKARAPAYIQSLFEDSLHGKGLGLHELAVFAATLEDLIHAEAAGQLEWIYEALRLPTDVPLSSKDADSATHFFMVAYLNMGEAFATNKFELRDMEAKLSVEYPGFADTSLWMTDLRQTFALKQLSRQNPFVERVANFQESIDFALEFGHLFGSFQNLECHSLKRKLLDMEHLGTGRVLLSTFYSRALAGAWEFSESIEYLRNQGALDETNPNTPSLVIPNYINSRANCLAGSDFYAICCINECEALMGRLEEQLATPRAAAAGIAEVVSSLHSDTVDAPRNLSAVLLARLQEIAHFHGGPVPLHGRLFAQWMHHAYPRECPFPQVSGTPSQLTQEEWVDQMGIELLEASQEMMMKYAAQTNASSEVAEALPWTFEEELVAEHREVTRGFGSLRSLAALGALMSFAVPLVRACWRASANPADSMIEKHLV